MSSEVDGSDTTAATDMSSDTLAEADGPDITDAPGSFLCFLDLADDPGDRFGFLSRLDENMDDDFDVFVCFFDVLGVCGMSNSVLEESEVSSRIFLGFLLRRRFLAHMDKSLWMRR